MITAALLWLMLCLGFAGAAPQLIEHALPATAVRLTVASSVALTATGGFVFGSLAATWVGQRPVVAHISDLNAAKLHAVSPIPNSASLLAAVVLLAACASLAVRVWCGVAAQRTVRNAAGSCHEEDTVVVLEDSRAEAFATPGRHGRIVITTGLLSALQPAERDALLAHEQAHLRHAHACWRLIMQVTAAANPLLLRVCPATDHAMERWADEDAAAQVGDRRLVARTVARVSLMKKHGTTAAVGLALAATGGDVPARVRALLAPRRSRGRAAAIALAVFLAGALVTAVLMQRTADGLFDAATR